MAERSAKASDIPIRETRVSESISVLSYLSSINGRSDVECNIIMLYMYIDILVDNVTNRPRLLCAILHQPTVQLSNSLVDNLFKLYGAVNDDTVKLWLDEPVDRKIFSKSHTYATFCNVRESLRRMDSPAIQDLMVQIKTRADVLKHATQYNTRVPSTNRRIHWWNRSWRRH